MAKKNSSLATEKEKPLTAPEVVFPVVGIGASAGGLEALELFFSHMPVDSGMAFVVIQHLDPQHKSSLAEILARSTEMSVAEIADAERLQRLLERFAAEAL